MIPKIIHFIWLGPTPIPEYAKSNISKWKELYPDYEIKLWVDIDFISNNLLEFYNDNQLHVAFKADIARYHILQKHGGLYFDTDFKPLKRIPDYFLNFDFLGGIQNNGEVAIGFIGSIPNSPIIGEIINKLPESIRSNQLHSTYVNENITGITGPKFASPIFSKFKRDNNCFFFTPDYFYPYWADEKDRADEDFIITSPLAYAVHHWAAEWLDN